MSKEEDDRKIRNTLIKEATKNGFNKGINQIIDSLIASGMSKEEIEKRININPEFREYMSYDLEQEILRNSERKLGFEEGIEQGIEQGIQQRNNEIVNNLLNTDMNISEISKIVNLPEEEIIRIKDAK